MLLVFSICYEPVNPTTSFLQTFCQISTHLCHFSLDIRLEHVQVSIGLGGTRFPGVDHLGNVVGNVELKIQIMIEIIQ